VDGKRARRVLEHLIDLLPLGLAVVVLLILFYWS
jgi:hypothetical protein